MGAVYWMHRSNSFVWPLRLRSPVTEKVRECCDLTGIVITIVVVTILSNCASILIDFCTIQQQQQTMTVPPAVSCLGLTVYPKCGCCMPIKQAIERE
jgi:hypothetical protein